MRVGNEHVEPRAWGERGVVRLRLPAHPAERLVHRLHPGRQAAGEGRFAGLADVDLVEGFEQDVGLLVVLEDNGGEIDVKYFRWLPSATWGRSTWMSPGAAPAVMPPTRCSRSRRTVSGPRYGTARSWPDTSPKRNNCRLLNSATRTSTCPGDRLASSGPGSGRPPGRPARPRARNGVVEGDPSVGADAPPAARLRPPEGADHQHVLLGSGRRNARRGRPRGPPDGGRQGGLAPACDRPAAQPASRPSTAPRKPAPPG